MAIAEKALQMDYQEQVVVSFAESERMKDVRCWSSFCSFFSELFSANNCCSCHEQAKVDNSNDVLQNSPSLSGSAPHKTLLPGATVVNSSKPLHSSASSKHSATLPTGRALGRTVTGTIFGYRKGKVTFCVQEEPKATPSLLLELAMPTDILVREMASGLLRIALECETKGRNKHQEDMESEDGSTKPRKPTPLILEPVWSMFCNGRKVGFAIRRTCSESDRLVLSVIEQVSMGAGVIPVDEQHRPVVLSPDARSRSKQSSRRTSPDRHRSEGYRWFPSVAKSARTSPERERRMGGPGSRDQSYRSSPDHRFLRDRSSYRSSPERAVGRERRSSLDMRRVSDDRDMTPVKTRSFDRSLEERAKVLQQHERFEDRLKGAHERSKSGDHASFDSISDKSPRRSPRRGIGLLGATDENGSRQSTEFGTPPSVSKSEPKSNSKSDYGTPQSDLARRSLESEDEDVLDTATSTRSGIATASGNGTEKGDGLAGGTQVMNGNGAGPGSAHSVKRREVLSNGTVGSGFSDNGDAELSTGGSRFTRHNREDDHTPVSYHRIDEHMPLETGNGFLIRPSKLDVYNDLDDDHQFNHRPIGNGFHQDGHSHKPSHVATEELMYMRARYEHVVGSADAESFHMINPDGSPGQELSVFFLRI